MSGSNVQLLAQAHAYIEAGNLEDAENLIRSLLEQEPDNTDAWWLLAHSVRDSNAAREALFQVLRLDPNDQQARSLLSALDERFPDESGGGGGGLRLPRPRFSLPRTPSFAPSAFGGLATPASYLVLLVLLVVGGWLLLRYFGFDLQLNPAAPVVSDTATAEVAETTAAPTLTDMAVVTQAAAIATFTVTAESAQSTISVTVTAPAAVTVTGDAQQPVETVEATLETGQAVPALSVTGATALAADAGASPAPVTAAVVPPSPAAEEITATPAPTVEPSPAPTYPYPTQTDPAEFAADYVAAFAEAGLQLAADVPLMEGSQFGSTALAGVCLDAGSGLRGTIDAAMSVMGGFAAQLNNSAPALGVRVIDCEDGALVRVIAAPLETALQWSEGTIDLAAWQSEWRAVG